MDKEFDTWLIGELDERGWSNSELARRAGVVPSTVSMILSGQNRPGFDFCVKIARALREPPESVLRKAGLLPPLPTSVEEEREALGIFRTLPAAARTLVLDMLRGLARNQGGPVIAAVGESPPTYDARRDGNIPPEQRARIDRIITAWLDVADLDPGSLAELLNVVETQAEMARALLEAGRKLEQEEEGKKTG